MLVFGLHDRPALPDLRAVQHVQFRHVYVAACPEALPNLRQVPDVWPLMARWLLASLVLMLSTSAWAQDQPPNTWVKLTFPVAAIDQPVLGGDQSIPRGQPGAAYTLCPRPIQTDAAGIFRSYSGTLVIPGGKVLMPGGGHAGHPGNDIPILDFINRTRTYPWRAECPQPYNADGTPNRVWRGIRGGGVMTAAVSPAGRPLVQHMYMNHAFDTKRNRYLVINGLGLMANPLGTGQWATLAGKDPRLNEVVWGSAGGMIYDDERDSVFLFVSDSQNGAPDGIYEYRFGASGVVVEKRRVMEWPSTPGMCWRCANTIHALYAKERREAILMVTPSSTSPSVPRNQLWRFHLDTGALTRDFTWVPGTPQYDQVYAVDQTRARLLARAPSEVWLLLAGSKHLTKGAWVQNDAVSPPTWRWQAIPGTPGIVWWSFFCDGPSGYCGGIKALTTYCPTCPAGSAGGKAELWRYRRP